MNPPPYTLPLRILKSGESFAIEDAGGAGRAYVYFEDEPTRRGLPPAMAAGVSDRLWEIADIVALVEAAESAREAGFLSETRVGLSDPETICRQVYEETAALYKEARPRLGSAELGFRNL